MWGTEATGLPERIPCGRRLPIESGGPTALPRDSKNVEVAFDCTLTHTHTNSYMCICLVVLVMVLNIRAAGANGTATAALPE